MDTQATSAHPATAPGLRRPDNRHDFEIALICALTLEADAIYALFDRHWDDPSSYGKAPGDSNAYSLGAIGRHNVVLAHMPGMGKAHAAAVATSCRASFPNIKLAIVVGVCGAVPFVSGGEEILLGDVIISEGLVQYDLGRRLPERFVRKDGMLDSLGRPSSEIMALLSKLKGIRDRKALQDRIMDYLNVLRNESDLGAKYPGKSLDRLFTAAYRHIQDGISCDVCKCSGQLIVRTRLEQPVSQLQPAVHFGLIASGDMVMKSGEERDAVAKRENVVAFEMEGAGVWDAFPCVVIKGVCDYADSHKTKEWQSYAAATAAACTKAFLAHWVLRSDGRAPDNILSHESSQKRRSLFLNRLSPEHAMSKYEVPNYQAQKDRNPHRVAGTCEWFIKHPRFQEWQEQKSALLWVSADPGCGKSVLARFLIDEVVPSTNARTTCYFFFKDDYEDQKIITGALCCILYQLFRQQPILLSDHILDEFEEGGDDMYTTFQALWYTLIQITKRDDCGEVICIMDALDECNAQGQTDLIQALSNFYQTRPKNSRLKIMVTSRPYVNIQKNFQRLENYQPTIHLSGEDEREVEKISKEIDLVIQDRLSELSISVGISEQDKRVWQQELLSIDNRTYLWVYLVFNSIQEDTTFFTQGELHENIRNLPKTVEEAYEKILNKSADIYKAKKLLHIVVTANRPLSVHEMALALALNEKHRSHQDLTNDLLPPDRLRRNIREVCGLFVTVKDSKVYLLHQTARDFLVRPISSRPTSQPLLRWQYALVPTESNKILSEICMRYLSFTDFKKPIKDFDFRKADEGYGLLDYAAKHWATHFRQAYTESDKSMMTLALQLCNTKESFCLIWFTLYWKSTGTKFPQTFNDLMIASYFGLKVVVDSQLATTNPDISSKDMTYGRSALSWASEKGYEDVVTSLLTQVSKYNVLLRERLLRMSAIVNSKDKQDRTPIWYAAANGHSSIADKLIQKGADVNSKDKDGQTPMAWAKYNNHETTITLLQIHGAKDDLGSKYLLTKAAMNGHEAVVQMLLDKGASFESQGALVDHTPLTFAAHNGHEAVVQILLDRGADVEAYGRDWLTPLAWAAQNGHESVVQVLVDKGADLETRRGDRYDRPLTFAAQNGHEAVVQILLDKGAYLEARGSTGRTPLIWAARNGHAAVVQMLLDKGASLEVEDRDGYTPLIWAAQNGHAAVVQMLLDKGASLEVEDRNVYTPLLWASINKHEAIVQMLLDKGADLEVITAIHRTSLHWAASSGSEAVVQMLVDKGANLEALDEDSRTPLHLAARNGHEAVVQILVDKGANLEALDKDSRTPLHLAARKGHEALVQMLLAKGATTSKHEQSVISKLFGFGLRVKR